MTAVRDEWLRARERKRAAIAWSTALGFYVAAMAIAALLSLFRVEDIADYSGPIIVRLGSPEGVDAPKPKPEPLPAPVAPEAVETPAIPSDSPAPIVAAKPKPDTAPTPPVKAPAPTPSVPAPPVQSATPPAPAPVVIRGSESGNSYDLTLLSSSGVVGRSMYVPIWLFMPVPNELPYSIYNDIPDQADLPGTAETRKKLFTAYYKESNGQWLLKGFRQPDYQSRQSLWIMLEDSGYDVKNADYKEGKHLRPIVILFKVSSPGSDGKPRLESVHIESGSGISTIDDDVLYGFKMAEFSNSGSTSISGRFTYRF